MIDEPTPLTREQRDVLAREALEEAAAAARKYLEATGDGDFETLENCVVIYEATGLDAEGGRFYRCNYFVPEANGTPNTTLGVVTTGLHKVKQDVWPGSCGASE